MSLKVNFLKWWKKIVCQAFFRHLSNTKSLETLQNQYYNLKTISTTTSVCLSICVCVFDYLPQLITADKSRNYMITGPPEPGGPGGHWPPPQSFRKSMHKRALATPHFSRSISSGPLKYFQLPSALLIFMYRTCATISCSQFVTD